MSGAGPQADKRVMRTRAMLLDALAVLITERGYERLTIQNILDASGVGRATFYAHYESKDALLESSIAGLRQWLLHQAQARPGERLGFSGPFFAHLDGHRQLYRMTAGRRGEVTVGRLVRRMLRELIHADVSAHGARMPGSPPPELVTEYVVGALWSTVVWWMTSDATVPAADVNAQFRRLAFAGIPGADSSAR